MRWITWLALGVALGGTLWLLVRRDPVSEPLTVDEPAPTVDAPAWALLKSGTLALSVMGSDGVLPEGSQVGFETPRGVRLYYVDAQGHRTLTDVPLGDVTVVAEAPGYERATRRTRVEAGVPGELKLVLDPLPKGTAPPR